MAATDLGKLWKMCTCLVVCRTYLSLHLAEGSWGLLRCFVHQTDKGMSRTTAEGALGTAHPQHGESGRRAPCRRALADAELMGKE